ncbi:unnamed protein product [Agarophyton chilense]
MEEEEFLPSSQLAFSDDAKHNDIVPIPTSPAKRPRNDIEKRDAYNVSLEQKPTKRSRSEIVNHENQRRLSSAFTHHSPVRSSVSSHRKNPENILLLPQPIPFLLPDEYLLGHSVQSTPRPASSKSLVRDDDYSTKDTHSLASNPKSTCQASQEHLNASHIPTTNLTRSPSDSSRLISSQVPKQRFNDVVLLNAQEIGEVPSPPIFSSDEDKACFSARKPGRRLVNKPHEPIIECSNKTEPQLDVGNSVRGAGNGAGSKHKSSRLIEDTGAPPTNSRNSSYFSFSRFPPSKAGSSQERERPDIEGQEMAHESTEVKSGKKYYIRAFDYVVHEVLTRYKHVLSGDDYRFITLIKNGISPDAKALFVRVYRRKQPRWYRVASLEDSYRHEFNVSGAVEELCTKRIVLSSEYVVKGSELAACVLARDLLPTLHMDDVKKLCNCLVNYKKLKRLPKKKLIPTLRNMLLTYLGGRQCRGSAQQSTLSGLAPSQIFARAVLKKAGHSIRIPDHLLTLLEKVHFLFFLEEGHDSPNVILADTGKVKFPDYQYQAESKLFSSKRAFDAYRIALSLEQELDQKLAEKSYLEAASLGSIIELEVREFFEAPPRTNNTSFPSEDGKKITQLETHWASLLGHKDSKHSGIRREQEKVQILDQLRHPFFRRYTAQWVYVRACYHSVHAFECLREYESAVELLKLLLSTSLVPKRRGKCLNRITINLFKHLGRPQDAWAIIINSLDPKKQRLHLGDRLALAKRGAAIHKKLMASNMKRKSHKERADEDLPYTNEEHKSESDISPELPEDIATVLNESGAMVKVRKIYGKSLNVQVKESEAQRTKERNLSTDPWYQNMFDRSRDSLQSASSSKFSLHSRAVFPSFRKNGGNISVEEYCMEWYLAKEGWSGAHDEGRSIRFIFSLLMWESALFASIPDVFQTPFQDKPLDLFTEAFYESRSEVIENRLQEISVMSPAEVSSEIEARYEKYNGTRAIGCDWNSYTVANLAAIGGGLGGSSLSHCFRLLCHDYNYWGGGLPDLTLWKVLPDDLSTFTTKLVEVKSARDNLSERQKAWLLEIQKAGALCEVCKVVERVTSVNALQLEEAKLDSVCLDALNATNTEQL